MHTFTILFFRIGITKIYFLLSIPDLPMHGLCQHFSFKALFVEKFILHFVKTKITKFLQNVSRTHFSFHLCCMQVQHYVTNTKTVLKTVLNMKKSLILMQFYGTCKNLYFLKFFKVSENRLNYHLLGKYGTLGIMIYKVWRN